MLLAAAAPALAWGLTLTSSGLAEDVVREPLRIEGGHAAVPEGIGLGIEFATSSGSCAVSRRG